MAGSGSRRLAWGAVVAVFLLMTLGNVVSATGSGLACPDWPLCHGSLVPQLRPDVLVEYSHRLAALVASVLIVATIVATLRGQAAPGARRVGMGLLVLLGVQIALGGITVLLRLPHLVSTTHLVNALLILGGLLTLAAGPGPPGMLGREGSVARLSRAGLAVLLLQMAVGGYVRHTGAGLACPDFPLCSGDLLPGHWLAGVHWVHRWLGVILIGLFLHLAVAARRTALAPAARLACLLAVVQVVLGVAAVLLRLTPESRATHAAVGYALWGTLVWLSVRSGLWTGVLRASSKAAVREGAVSAA
ncbi:MAG TPA: COX15/CtaA family protein [Methylomirabilota bacterium]|nr:COX15/CtaA family protein [Methylomirabilota bacterium]